MKRVRIHLSDRCYVKKPEKREYARINNEITKKVSEVDIATFAREVGMNGRPFTPALFHDRRKKEDFAQEQVYALDFDDGITVGEFLSRAERYHVPPAFIYATYSHSEDHPRFRPFLSTISPSRTARRPQSSWGCCTRSSQRRIRIAGMSAGSIWVGKESSMKIWMLGSI